MVAQRLGPPHRPSLTHQRRGVSELGHLLHLCSAPFWESLYDLPEKSLVLSSEQTSIRKLIVHTGEKVRYAFGNQRNRSVCSEEHRDEQPWEPVRGSSWLFENNIQDVFVEFLIPHGTHNSPNAGA